MIGFLRGRLEELAKDHVVLDVGGVGYVVYVPESAIGRLGRVGQEIKLHTRLYVREDALQLYGFPDADQCRAFELLMTVSGIGPRLALAILSAVNPDGLRQAVYYEDTALLSKIPGIGRKTAQRLVLELKGKLAPVAAAASIEGPAEVKGPHAEAIEALVALGYNRAEARAAVEQVQSQPLGEITTEAVVKAALKYLASG